MKTCHYLEIMWVHGYCRKLHCLHTEELKSLFTFSALFILYILYYLSAFNPTSVGAGVAITTAASVYFCFLTGEHWGTCELLWGGLLELCRKS